MRVFDGEDCDALIILANALKNQHRLLQPGFVDVSEFMSKSDAFVLSSHGEGFPLVLIDLMAYGLLVIAYELLHVLKICLPIALLATCGNVVM